MRPCPKLRVDADLRNLRVLSPPSSTAQNIDSSRPTLMRHFAQQSRLTKRAEPRDA